MAEPSRTAADTPPMDRLRFFLGGHDLEMVTIRDLLNDVVPGAVHDRQLQWGAKASDYRDELMRCIEQGLTPVLVEVADDLGVTPSSVVVVDHHGQQSGAAAPTSLHQVFALLRLPPGSWTRWLDLVAANDRGHVAGLVDAGATHDEIVKIRAADRAAQGATADEEEAGERAARGAERLAGGRLTIVRLPHTRTATVADRLHVELGGPGYENLLIFSPHEINFFGSGDLVLELDREYPGGWWGGALPARGFWGHAEPSPAVVQTVLSLLDHRPERDRIQRCEQEGP